MILTNNQEVSCDKCECAYFLTSVHSSDVTPVGKTLAFTSIRFMNNKDELVARGSHTK